MTASLEGTVGPREEPGLLVLRDLRTVYLMPSDNSLLWEVLAQARNDTDLLDVVTSCHPQTLRQLRWATEPRG